MLHPQGQQTLRYCVVADIDGVWDRGNRRGGAWLKMANEGSGLQSLPGFARCIDGSNLEPKRVLGYRTERGPCLHRKLGCCGAKVVVHEGDVEGEEDVDRVRRCRRCSP